MDFASEEGLDTKDPKDMVRAIRYMADDMGDGSGSSSRAEGLYEA